MRNPTASDPASQGNLITTISPLVIVYMVLHRVKYSTHFNPHITNHITSIFLISPLIDVTYHINICI